MSHTPGPWEVHACHFDQFIRTNVYFELRCKEGAARVAKAEGMTSESKANARLMAAAPDMFDVIKAYEQWEADLILSNEAWNGSLPCMTQELYDRFIEIQSMRNSAIAKAKGES